MQCCHQQPLIDKMIPIYFKGGPKTTVAAELESRMSHIFVSDKARKSTSSKDGLHSITRRHESISGSGSDSGSLPYIAILADLGQPSSFSVTFPERDVDDRCLRVYAAGVDTSTYPFLAKYPAIMSTLQDLVHLQEMPTALKPYMGRLDGQARVGITSERQHMSWRTTGRS